MEVRLVERLTSQQRVQKQALRGTEGRYRQVQGR